MHITTKSIFFNNLKHLPWVTSTIFISVFVSVVRALFVVCLVPLTGTSTRKKQTSSMQEDLPHVGVVVTLPEFSQNFL